MAGKRHGSAQRPGSIPTPPTPDMQTSFTIPTVLHRPQEFHAIWVHRGQGDMAESEVPALQADLTSHRGGADRVREPLDTLIMSCFDMETRVGSAFDSLTQATQHDRNRSTTMASEAAPAPLPSLTFHEPRRRNRLESCWVVLHSKVYDISYFLSERPGVLLVC